MELPFTFTRQQISLLHSINCDNKNGAQVLALTMTTFKIQKSLAPTSSLHPMEKPTTFLNIYSKCWRLMCHIPDFPLLLNSHSWLNTWQLFFSSTSKAEFLLVQHCMSLPSSYTIIHSSCQTLREVEGTNLSLKNILSILIILIGAFYLGPSLFAHCFLPVIPTMFKEILYNLALLFKAIQ